MGFCVMHKNGVFRLFRYDRLDELVKLTGKKKNYLSQKMGHSGRYLNDAKKQNTDIRIEDVEILASELSTSVAYLRGEADEKEKPASEEAGFHPTLEDWLNAIDRMSREEMRAVMSRVMERYAGEDK